MPELAELDTIMQKGMSTYGVPGASLAVLHNGMLVFARGYGYADTATKAPVQPDSLFRIASITKPVTGAAIAKLIERGKLSASDKVFTILSAIQPLPGAKEDPRVAQITVQNLLDHESGWYGEADGTGYDPMFDVVNIAKAAGVTAPADPTTIARYMLGRPLDRDPGTYYSYSNTGYMLLGLIIQQISGESYESFVTANVMGPIGNSRSQFGATLTALPGEVTYYPYAGQALATSVFPTGPQRVPSPYGGFSLEAHHANGGLVSNSMELLQYLASVNGSRGPGLFVTPLPGFPSYIPPYGNKNYTWFFHGSLPGDFSSLYQMSDQTAFCYLTNSRPAPSAGDPAADLDAKLKAAIQNVKVWPATDQFRQFTNSFIVLNAATYLALPAASDQFVTLLGDSLASTTESAQAVPLPTTLGNATVTVKDSTGYTAPCQLVYASPGQINLLVPPGLALGAATFTVNGAKVRSAAIEIDSLAPGLFTANSSGIGVPAGTAVRIGSDGTQTPVELFHCPAGSPCVPTAMNVGAATDQLILSLYGTGIRHVSALSKVKALVKGISVPVLFAGAQGQFAGLDQVNIQIPPSLKGSGNVAIQLTMDGRSTNTVTVNIQ